MRKQKILQVKRGGPQKLDSGLGVNSGLKWC